MNQQAISEYLFENSKLSKSINMKKCFPKQNLTNNNKDEHIRLYSQISIEKNKNKHLVCLIRQLGNQQNRRFRLKDKHSQNMSRYQTIDKNQKRNLIKILSVESIKDQRKYQSIQVSSQNRRREISSKRQSQDNKINPETAPSTKSQLYIKFPQLSLMQQVLKIKKNNLQLKQLKNLMPKAKVVDQLYNPQVKNQQQKLKLVLRRRQRIKYFINTQAKIFKINDIGQQIAGWTIRQLA